MKKSLKVIALFCALSMTLFGFSACQKEESDPSSTTSGASSTESTAKEKLTVGTNSEFPPFEYQENGQVVGIDMDIMKAVAEKIGMELVIVDMDFNALPTALSTGQIDCIAAGFSTDATREETMDFSDTYYKASQSILVPADSAINTADDLKNKRLGAQSGTTGEETATDVPGAEAKGYRSPMLAVQDMMNGNLDAVIVDKNPAEVIKDQYGDEIKLITDQFPEEEYAIAVNKGNSKLLDKINDALKTILSDGTFDEIVKKYVD